MKTLIQIVSEQTMPNLLPAMAIQPERIVHLCTPQMQSVSKHLVRAYNAAGVHTTVEVVPLEKPDLHGTFDAMRKILRNPKNEASIVNLTGGTKLMSIAAYASARVEKTASLYFDPQTGFIDGKTGYELSNIFPGCNEKLIAAANRLTVEIIAIANGVESVTPGRKWKPLVAVARHLLSHDSDQKSCFLAGNKVLQSMPRGYRKRRNLYISAYGTNVEGIPRDVQEYLIHARLFKRENGKLYPDFSHLDPLRHCTKVSTQEQWHSAIESAEHPFKFLMSGWWEVAVADFFERKRGCRGILWDSDAGSLSTRSTKLEEDVLGVMGTDLLYVSCKLGGTGDKLSGELEGSYSRGRRIGGSCAKKVFAVFLPQHQFYEQRLKNRCAELRMEYLDGQTVRAALP